MSEETKGEAGETELAPTEEERMYEDAKRRYDRAGRRLDEAEEALEQWKARRAQAGYGPLDAELLQLQKNVKDANQLLNDANQRLKDARAAAEKAAQQSAEKTSQPSIDLTTLKRKDHPRQSRWDSINTTTDPKRTKKFDSVAYSNVSWPLLKPIYMKEIEDYVQEYDTTALTAEKMTILMTYLELCRMSLRHVLTGQEAHRVHLIMPILVCVSALFDGDVKILIEEDVYGERVRVHGHFEFVLERKGKKVCVVEAKMDDFDQGLPLKFAWL